MRRFALVWLLPTIRMPTLIIRRTGDLDRDGGGSRRMAGRIPGARYVKRPGTDHLLWVGRQDANLDEVEDFLTRVWPTPEPDRVLATILFTDIAGSTERAAALGDRRWRDLFDRHNALVRRELARFRGREIEMIGDGFHASFNGPARGIRCACAVSQAVCELGIQIRAGLHTGEVEIRGGSVGGIAVHIAARVAAQARAGEILVSSTVKDLVAGSGLKFHGRGVHALKGVPGEWRLFAVDRTDASVGIRYGQ